MSWNKIKQLKKIKLEAEEKNSIRDFLSVRIGMDERHIYHKPFLIFNLFKHKTMFAGILAVIILLTSGGTTFAAENALPGDVLYSVKTHVNEKVMEVLARNDEKKADLSTRLAERRLDEADKLSVKGKLNPDNSAQIAEQLKKHLDKTNELVKKLEEKGNIQAASRVNAHLKHLLLAHENDDDDEDDDDDDDNTTATSTPPIVTASSTPSTVTTASSTTSTSTTNLKDDDDEDDDGWKKDKWSKLRKEIKIQIASSTIWEINIKNKFTSSTVDVNFKAQAAAGVKKAAENKLDEVQKYFDHKKDNLSAENKTEVQKKLNEALSTKSKADQKLAGEQYVEAFSLYHESMKKAQEAKLLIEHVKKEKKDNSTASSTKKWFEDDDDKTSSSTKNNFDKDDDKKERSESRKNKQEEDEEDDD